MFHQSLGMRLRSAYLTFHRLANSHFEAFGVTADQFVILTLLAEEEGITQRELVERACSDPNTVGEMLGRLEKKDLVRRERHPSDGRARCVVLTETGRALQAAMEGSWKRRLGEIEAQFLPEELDVLGSLLGRVSASVASVRLAEVNAAEPTSPAEVSRIPSGEEAR